MLEFRAKTPFQWWVGCMTLDAEPSRRAGAARMAIIGRRGGGGVGLKEIALVRSDTE
jgi:hypothetical protein